MKIASVLLLLVFCLFLFTENAEAKVLPQAQKAGGKVTVSKSGAAGIGVSPRLRRDKKALIVNFSNLQNATAVSYLLTYKTSTQNEGARGGINLGSSNTSQELLFGTCSKNVCRYHTGLSNMKLEVSYTTKLGKKYIKRYRIKV